MAEGGGSEGRQKTLSAGSEFVFDFYCELCKDDDKHVEAEGFCVDCGEYLCGHCYSSHQRTRQTRHHELLDKSQMPKDTPLSADRVSRDISTKCKLHAGKPVEFYCQTHSDVGCYVCFRINHRNCSGVESILEKSENILNSREYGDFIQTLKSLEQKSRDITAKARGNITQAKACYSEVIKSVKLLREEITKTLDKLEKDIGRLDALGKISGEMQDIKERQQAKVNTPVLMRATHKTDTDVKSNTDYKTSAITGSAVVNKDRLILADFHNYKVKLVDTDADQVVSELKVSYKPCDVTVISRNQAAVSLWNNPTVLLLRVSDTLTMEREITVNGGCGGVAYSKNRLVVTYLNPPKLEIMEPSGNVMKRIENDSDGKKLFQWPLYVCVSKDDETIFVSDSRRNTVTSLTFDGVVKAVYSDSELKDARKVCIDHHGNVYVCGYFSRNVHMLTGDLIKIQIILTETDGLTSYVHSVNHCPETNKLYVGMTNDKLKVYQLS